MPLFPRVPLAITLLALAVSGAHAQNATTTPVGVVNITFPATGASPATTSRFMSIPLQSEPIFAGSPTSVSADTMTFNGTAWSTSPSALGSTPPRFFVRVLSGEQAGRILQIVSNTANSVVVQTNDRTLQSTPLNGSGFSISTQDRIEICEADTLAGIFGNNTVTDPLLLVGATSAFTADTVSIFDRSTGVWVGYFFNTSVNQWRRSTGGAAADSTPIFPDDALLVVRRTNRPAVQLSVTGRVPTVAPLIKANPGRAYVTNLGVPVDMTLAAFSLSGGWTRSNSAFTADSVTLFGTTSTGVSYFQRSDGSWRNSPSVTAPDVSSTMIPAGAAVTILERSTSVSGNSSFNRFSLPYSLN